MQGSTARRGIASQQHRHENIISYHHQRNSPAAYPLSVLAAHPLNTSSL